MAQNKKTQRKFRKKSSKRNVGKRKTKVKRKMKGGNCYKIYVPQLSLPVNELYLNYDTFKTQVYRENFKEQEIEQYMLTDTNKKRKKKPIDNLVIGIEYIIRTMNPSRKCQSEQKKLYIKINKEKSNEERNEVIQLAIDLIIESLQKIIGRSALWDKCNRKKSWTYTITSTERNDEYVQCIQNKITIYDTAFNAIEYLIKFFEFSINLDEAYKIFITLSDRKKEFEEGIEQVTPNILAPTLCQKLRTLLKSLLSKDVYTIQIEPKREAIDLLKYFQELLVKKKISKEAKISTNTTSPSSHTNSFSELSDGKDHIDDGDDHIEVI